MINVTLKDSNGTAYLSDKVQATIEIDEQLDTSLDSGTIKYLTKEADNKGLNEALAKYSIVAGDFKFDFVGMDSRALVRREGFGYVTDLDTVTQSSRIESRPSTIPSMGFAHTARGEIIIDKDFVSINIISGNIPATKRASYDADKLAIVWIAQWFDNIENYTEPFTIKIVYRYATGEKYPQSIYSHQVSLTEPSKLLQGVLIDGFAVTQPEEYDERQTLFDVVKRLLEVTPFDGQRFFWVGNINDDVLVVLRNTISPEFKWNTQTTLWECLLQVGAVIDAIPRLVAYGGFGNYIGVTFEFVNACNNYVDAIDDSATNAAGENVDESQYNTALSSVVENLRESE